MRCVVAVSGGIDSVVLLDTLVRARGHELIVAHFDHGIRDDSAADARFVEELAKRHDIQFVTKREELGKNASEELARERRYEFLRNAAREHDARIVTAHHGDDVVETVAINVMRGTGWRGLAVLNTHDILRPLLGRTKGEIRDYALHHRLEWVEDSTNAGTDYLRNRIRRTISQRLSPSDRQSILNLWQKQIIAKVAIDEEARVFVQSDATYSRYLFTQIDAIAGHELLRAVIHAATGISPTRPQAQRALLAVKTARANTQHQVSGTARIRFGAGVFIVETP